MHIFYCPLLASCILTLFLSLTHMCSCYEAMQLFGIKETHGFPGISDCKESAFNAGDQGSIPGSGRSTGEGNGNPLQYSCLQNSMDRGA